MPQIHQIAFEIDTWQVNKWEALSLQLFFCIFRWTKKDIILKFVDSGIKFDNNNNQRLSISVRIENNKNKI